MKSLTITALAAAFTAVATPSQAQHHGHLEHLEANLINESHRVEKLAGTLRNEFNIHFRYTSIYGHLINDVNGVIAGVSQIHGMAHHIHSDGDLHRLENHIERLDKFVHHLGEVIVHATHDPHHPVSYGEVNHVRQYIATLNNSLHRMEAIVEDMESHIHAPVPVPDHGHGGHGHEGHGGHEEHGHDDHGHGHGHGHGVGEHIRDRVIEGVVRGLLQGGRGHGHHH